MNYITTAGPKSGPIRWNALAASLGVYEDGGARSLPCGVASPVAWDDQGRTLFSLLVRGASLSGRWLVVDRRFIPADMDG